MRTKVGVGNKRKFTSQGKTKTMEGKANESNEYIIANTSTTFPGCALLCKTFGAFWLRV